MHHGSSSRREPVFAVYQRQRLFIITSIAMLF